MFEYFSWNYLSFLRSSEPAAPVPKGLHRYWLETAGGRIEILAAEPETSQPADANAPSILFCHGGMGGAWVWTEYMLYLREAGVRSYAVSLRGHGDSWSPGYLRMVFGTTRSALEDDLVGAFEWVKARTGGEVVLVGHSSGGGLSQSILSQGRVQVRGLALLGAIPAFGSLGVYMNWAALDPWFQLRMLAHFGHPNSPLSHPSLTKAAFFSDAYPMDKVLAFQRRTSRFESFWWPLSMLRPFAAATDILKSIKSQGKVGVLVMAGDHDALMTPDVTRQTTAFYRAKTEGVRMELVEGAGHHLQNDTMWEDGAGRLLEWYRQL